MMALGKPGYVWDGTEWVPIGAPVDGADLGVTDHPALTGRTAPDSHPTSAITGLDPALAGKADVVHTHPGLNIQAGTGIALSNGDPNVITNTDTGSAATGQHDSSPAAHAGVLAAEDHTHTGEYAPDPHDHPGQFDPAGTAATAVLDHNVPSSHPGIAAAQVLAGEGIGVTQNPDGTITVDNLSQGGQPLIAGGNQLGSNFQCPSGAWTKMPFSVSYNAGNIVVTDQFVIPATGSYIVTAGYGFASNDTGQRGIRMMRNGANADAGNISRLPTIAGSAFGASWGNQYQFVEGDVITFEAYQDSGAALAMTTGTNRVAISKINGAVNDSIIGYGSAQLSARNIPDNTYQAMQLDRPILTTLDVTSGTTVATAGYTLGPNAPAGWYDCFAAVGISGNTSGSARLVRVTVNGDPVNAPLIPIGGMNLSGTSFAGGRVAYIQTSGPVYLKPGDRIAMEAFQNSGVTLTSSIDNTVMTIMFRGIDDTRP